MRPDLLVVVTGTGTEVGKTWVTAAAAPALEATCRKPAQSYEVGDPLTDADVLARATGDDPRAVCPEHRWYEVPMAPPMAAEVLGRPPFSTATLADEVAASWPASTRIGIVEGAGGACSPLAQDGDTVALATVLGADLVVLVADAGLGTIHAVRASLAALAGLPTVVVLNRYDAGRDLHRRNHDWLVQRERLEVLTSPDQLVARLRR